MEFGAANGTAVVTESSRMSGERSVPERSVSLGKEGPAGRITEMESLSCLDHIRAAILKVIDGVGHGQRKKGEEDEKSHCGTWRMDEGLFLLAKKGGGVWEEKRKESPGLSKH
ncbi:hypothetical protein PMAYCL1PPCAC_30213 [Pristionchus mayeri]|uniref:Uncharacterized protein n=1 Tax=Pristionchus mayeri TaxID=1317129 RepID=A0AAN5DAN0_9BILA|nr:hypothetical protein PMAYCL1PPCAC_30213 [Pristionchus mayeri]